MCFTGMAAATVLMGMTAGIAGAQTVKADARKLDRRMLNQARQLNAGFAKLNKTAATGYRISGMIALLTDGTIAEPIDSMNCTYVGKQGDQNFMEIFDPFLESNTINADDVKQLSYDDAGPGWIVNEHYVQTFNPGGQVLTSIYSSDQSGTMKDESKTEYTYDAQARMTQALQSNWTGSAWELVAKDVFKYNAQGKNDTVLNYNIDAGGNAALFSGYYNVFSGTGQHLQRVEFNVSIGGTRDAHTKYTRSYNGNDEIGMLNEAYLNSAWLAVDKSTYSYDAAHQRTGSVTELWNGTSWEPGEEMAYKWVNGRIDSMISEFMPGVYLHGKLYYESFTTGVTPRELPGASVNLYPNPARNQVTLDVQLPRAEQVTVSLYNVTGARMLSMTASNAQQNLRERIDLSMLPAGMYQLQVATPSGAVSRTVSVIK